MVFDKRIEKQESRPVRFSKVPVADTQFYAVASANNRYGASLPKPGASIFKKSSSISGGNNVESIARFIGNKL